MPPSGRTGTRNIVAVLPTRSSSTVKRFAATPKPYGFRRWSALRVERDGHVLRVTLARPERRNAFDAALIAELTEAFADVGDARAVVLAGDGPSFCAGADVEWQRSSIDLSYDENVEDAMRLYRMLRSDRLLPCACRLPRPGLRARRRLGARRVRGHRGRAAGSRVRLHGGPAGDHPCSHLPVRPPEDRVGGPALLPHRRALRRRRRAPDRARARGRGERRRGAVGNRRRAARRRPGGRARGEAARARATGRHRDGADRGRRAARATRARRVCGPSSTSARPPGTGVEPRPYASQEKTTDAAERSTGPWYTASTFVPSGIEHDRRRSSRGDTTARQARRCHARRLRAQPRKSDRRFRDRASGTRSGARPLADRPH